MWIAFSFGVFWEQCILANLHMSSMPQVVVLKVFSTFLGLIYRFILPKKKTMRQVFKIASLFLTPNQTGEFQPSCQNWHLFTELLAIHKTLTTLRFFKKSYCAIFSKNINNLSQIWHRPDQEMIRNIFLNAFV